MDAAVLWAVLAAVVSAAVAAPTLLQSRRTAKQQEASDLAVSALRERLLEFEVQEREAKMALWTARGLAGLADHMCGEGGRLRQRTGVSIAFFICYYYFVSPTYWVAEEGYCVQRAQPGRCSGRPVLRRFLRTAAC